jgi:hypothetical protein
MSPVCAVLIVLAGLSESFGRILPIISRRPNIPARLVGGLLITGTAVEAIIIAAWPLAATTAADLVRTTSGPLSGLDGVEALAWTPGSVAPLLLCAVLAFPLLGPVLHSLIFVGVGISLVTPLTTTSGLGWWAAAGCVTVAGIALAAVVATIRHLVAQRIALPKDLEALI